jgi:hypothetical protein
MPGVPKQAWLYELAKAWMSSSTFAGEIKWTAARSTCSLEEDEFLREAAWVVLCSGFREQVVRQKFGYVSIAFFDWISADAIVADAGNCVRIAMKHFGNEKKLQAIVRIAELVAGIGFRRFKEAVLADPLGTLQALPFVGPITAQHLAKNLGFPTVKADRHLVRLAEAFGFSDCHRMCADLAQTTGDSLAVVDTVLWRFCEQHPELT